MIKMIRYLKNRLEGRREIVDEDIVDWRHQKFLEHTLAGGVSNHDIPAALLRLYEKSIVGGVNFKAYTRLLDELSRGGNGIKTVTENVPVDEVVERIKILQDPKRRTKEELYPYETYADRWTRFTGRHQVFTGENEERHYLDLRCEYGVTYTRAWNGLLTDEPSARTPVSITLDFLVKKE